MFQTPLDLLNLLVQSSGDVLYFLVMFGISQASLIMALGEAMRQRGDIGARRYSIALFGILLTWVIVILSSLYSIVAAQSVATILPPLERAAAVTVILLAGWAFLSADRRQSNRGANVLLLLLLIAVIVGYSLNGIAWAGEPNPINYNLTPANMIWTFAALITSVIGFLLTVFFFRSVIDAPLKLVFFAILVVSASVTLIQISQFSTLGNYSGAARWGLFAALPLLPAILYRRIISVQDQHKVLARPIAMMTAVPSTASHEPISLAMATAPLTTPMQRESVQLLKALGLMLEGTDPAGIPERIVQAIIDILKGDIAAVFTFQDANYADTLIAYDRNRKRRLHGMSINLDNQPTLVNAVERRSQRPLFPDRNGEELRDLYNRLDIEDMGPAYFQPLVNGRELVGVLLVGMPYIPRELLEHERELLKGIGVIAGSLLAISMAARDARLRAEERAIEALLHNKSVDDIGDSSILAARQEMQAELRGARDQIVELTRQVSRLQQEMDAENKRMAYTAGETEEGISISQRILTLTDEHQKLREERDLLVRRIQEAETALAGAMASSNDDVYKHMIEVLRREKEDLYGQQQALRAEVERLRSTPEAQTGAATLREVAASLGQQNTQMESQQTQLTQRLADVASQLQALGIEANSAGMAQLIAQLTEQRNALQARLDAATLDRTALVRERVQYEDSLKQEKERLSRIQSLESELRHLASDREALLKERDSLRRERDELLAKQDSIKQNRARLLAEASGYQLELAESHQEQAKLRRQLQQLAAEKERTEQELLSSRDISADRAQLSTEDIAALVGQRDILQQELEQMRSQIASVTETPHTAPSSTIPENTPTSLIEMQRFDPEVSLSVIQKLRTPLTSIVGYVDLLLDESAGMLGEMQRSFVQRVQSNIDQLNGLLDQLTQITTLDTSRLILVQQRTNLVDLVEQSITNNGHLVRDRQLSIRLKLDDSLPDIRVDPQAVAQVVNQLLANALMVSPPNSQIIVSTGRQSVPLAPAEEDDTRSDCLVISVADEGGGIPDELLPHIFDRRHNDGKDTIPGLGDSGVGLSIARALVKAHNGRIWVQTKLGKGTTFLVALPLTDTVATKT